MVIGWVTGFALGVLTIETSPPLQGEARSGRVPMQNASAFCMGPGEGVGDVVDESKFRFFN